MLFRSREEDLRESWCCSSVVGWILIFVWSADIQSRISFQLCIPIWLGGIFSCLFSSIFFLFFFYDVDFFFFLPSSIRRHCDQFPRLNLWGVRRLYVRLERGVKLFSRQCDGVSRRCFSAIQKINIYWQGSEGFLLSFCLVTSVSTLLQGHETHWFVFCSNRESKSSSSHLVFFLFLDYLPVGARLWATNPHGW